MPTIIRIESGCICCQCCVIECPEVFAFPDDQDHAVVLGQVRADGVTSDNQNEGSPLIILDAELGERIREAAAGCPVEVFRLAG